ncbi:MAG: LamG-like jellyroll fold domain-containing protein, partial [Ignavibacteria bacterium]|nr:LamG-like jellyroll fold domain-containing protein [Ignavibacteria bacterium]
MISISYRIFVLFCFIIFLGAYSTNAQEPIGGPYTVDANTLVLLHFDDNFDNASTLAANGVGHTNAGSGGLIFLNSPLGTGMGKCLRLKNDAISDSSYISVADDDVLDLTGDWTIEGWMNVFTFGTTSGDHRWVPRLCIKTGDDVFWRPNWFVELWGDARRFDTGFQTADLNYWPLVSSADNVMTPGQWVHLTFIRDDTRKILIQMVHNAQRQLVYFGTASYANLPVQTPITTSQDVHIGWAGPGSTDSWLDGFVDELRISNIVRDFAVPPIIANVTNLPNQRDDVPDYVVEANIMAFAQTGTITTAEIKYSINGGTTWLTVAMTNTSGNDYSGAIPQQPFGTIIKYYISATDNGGLTSTYPALGASAPFQFAIYKPNMLVLHLDFEEGTGTPIDKSLFQNPVTSPRPFVYSNDAATGNYSILMESDAGTNLDSSFLEVDSPFLSSLDFNVDFWLKADSIKQYVRILNRPLAYGNWWQNNYEIRFQDIPVIRGRYLIDSPTLDQYVELTLTTSIQINTWYRVVFKRDSTMASLELFDANNQSLEVVSTTNLYDMPPIQPSAPLRIGNGGNVGGARGFEGKIDEVFIYNNSEGITTGVEPLDNEILKTFTLSQNYPNPFNPSTIIHFSVPKAERVSIAVYDLMGRKIKTLLNDKMHVGNFQVSWDGTNEVGLKVSSGVYFYSMKTESVTLSKKMLLLK